MVMASDMAEECDRTAGLEAVHCMGAEEEEVPSLSMRVDGHVHSEAVPDRADVGEAGAAIGEVVDFQPMEVEVQEVALEEDST